MPSARRADIQWLRAIAALSVVLWHSDLIVKHVWPGSLTDDALYSMLGGFGVELFFMLSGYSICMQVERVRRPGEFLLTRFYRIYPLYWFFTGLMLVAFVMNPNWPLSARAGDGAAYVLASLLALPQERLPLLPLGWTLELEFLFYLMVAATMALGGLGQRKPVLGWLLAGLGCLGFAIRTDPSGGMVIFEIINPFMAAFAFGWLLRCLETNGGRPKTFAVAATSLFLCLAAILPEREAHCALRMAMSVAILVGMARLEPIFQARPRVAWIGCLIGNASYSIYLSHWFVLSIAGKVLPSLPVHGLGSPGTRALGLVLSVGVGIAVHVLIEAGFSRAIAARRNRPAARPIGPSGEPATLVAPASLRPPP